jgi:hypothetical protein
MGSPSVGTGEAGSCTQVHIYLPHVQLLCTPSTHILRKLGFWGTTRLCELSTHPLLSLMVGVMLDTEYYALCVVCGCYMVATHVFVAK